MVLHKMICICLLLSLMMFPGRAQQNPETITTISLEVKTGLQFNIVRFLVKPGSTVRIILTNTDDMNHNLLITSPAARLEVVNEALALGDKGLAMNYTPASSKVLWAIPIVPPNDSKSITFSAPEVIGIYPYVCTIPGHGFIMYGAMYVSNDTRLPDISKDINVPPLRRDETSMTAAHTAHDTTRTTAKFKPLHPYTPRAPYLYRVFIEGASPAAIAVSLPRNISYCWDAGTCRLRFAWYGGFLDNSDLWKGKGDVVAKVTGTIFFRDKSGYPIRIDRPEEIPAISYKGYRLINRYPEFHYTINGTDVFELILPGKDSNELVRYFRMPSIKEAVWFQTNPADGAAYKASSGKWESGRLQLTPAQARKFNVTMSKRKEACYEW